MSQLKELKRLRDEERTLISLASLLTDQLNRLKVEELALLNKRRLQTTSANSQMSIHSTSQLSRHTKTDHEVYLAEEMQGQTSFPTQNKSTYSEDASVSKNPEDEVMAVDNKENLNHSVKEGSHVTAVGSHVTGNDVIPLDLRVTDHHHQASVEEMEEEEDD